MNILREPDYFKQIIFGFEDAFVSTVGILVGIAAATAYSRSAKLFTLDVFHRWIITNNVIRKCLFNEMQKVWY